MFAGDNDLDFDKQEVLKSLAQNVKTINILDVFNESVVGLLGAGWAIKPFAMLASSFQQVILVDADAVFLQPPETAFDDPGYNATGTLFFHDRVVDVPNHPRHRWWHSIMTGRTPSPALQQSKFWSNQTIDEMESGVVVINKGNKHAWVALMFASWMNTKVVRETTTYKYTHGTPCTYCNAPAPPYQYPHTSMR